MGEDVCADALVRSQGAALSALGGVDMALWDLRGQAKGRPVWALLGGESDRCPAYASGLLWKEDVKELGEEAAGYIEQGFRRVKMRLARSEEYDRAAVEAVRAQLALTMMSSLTRRCVIIWSWHSGWETSWPSRAFSGTRSRLRRKISTTLLHYEGLRRCHWLPARMSLACRIPGVDPGGGGGHCSAGRLPLRRHQRGMEGGPAGGATRASLRYA